MTERKDDGWPITKRANELMDGMRRMRGVKRRPGESRASHAKRVEMAADGERSSPSDDEVGEYVAQYIEHQHGIRAEPPDPNLGHQPTDTSDSSPETDTELGHQIAAGVEQELGVTTQGSDEPSESGDSDSGSGDDEDEAERIARGVEREMGIEPPGGGGNDDDEEPPDNAA